MTSCTFTTGQTPSAPCWEAFTALMYPTASRAAPTRSSWPSAATLPSAAMDLCCSTQVRPLLVWRSGVHICNKGSLSLSLSLSLALALAVSLTLKRYWFYRTLVYWSFVQFYSLSILCLWFGRKKILIHKLIKISLQQYENGWFCHGCQASTQFWEVFLIF